MNNKLKNLRKLMSGIAICAICSTIGGNASMTTAYASQGNHQNSSVIQGKEKKNNKKHENKGNHSGKSWNQKMIQTEGSVEEGREVKVAIIDSGVNFSMDINVVERMNFIEDDECSILYEDFSDHGTAVAGIIGALDNEEGITGVNPNVRIYSARVLDNDLQAPVKRIIAAIEWAMEKDVDIINMSLGIHTDFPELHQAVKDAYAQGILLVAAVGNDGSITYPAAYEEVIAVGSVDSCGVSVQGETVSTIVELMAPGENILSSAIFDGVIGGSGTSLATAHVTGVASVLMEMNPDMPAEFIRALMDYSANLYGDKEVYGNGLVDLEYAISITPSFKKVYEKYLRKSNQNEVQRKKQQEKFWGEIIKMVPQNEKDVEVFTEVEVVEGLWENGTTERDGKITEGHVQLIEDAYYINPEPYVYFTSEQLQIFKNASYKADHDSKLKDMDANPYHGFYMQRKVHDDYNGTNSLNISSNYVANYIYLTKLAMVFGNGSTSLNVNMGNIAGLNSDRISSDITLQKAGSVTWGALFNEMGVSNNNHNKKLFVYGLALHCATDVFAHSAWEEKPSGVWNRIIHAEDFSENADNPDKIADRYAAALVVAKNVLSHAYYGTSGLVTDFRVSESYFGEFYLKNLVDNIQDTDMQYYNYFSNDFNNMDYDYHVSD